MTFSEKHNNIMEDVEIHFNTQKLKKDLFEMLEKENVLLTKNHSTELYSYCVKNGDERKFLLTLDDELNILAVKIEKRYFGLSFIPLIIDVAIGNLKIYRKGIYEVGKCKCEFMYDTNKELIDVDFYHDEMCFVERENLT